jgi:hypothetical protein
LHQKSWVAGSSGILSNGKVAGRRGEELQAIFFGYLCEAGFNAAKPQ